MAIKNEETKKRKPKVLIIDFEIHLTKLFANNQEIVIESFMDGRMNERQFIRSKISFFNSSRKVYKI